MKYNVTVNGKKYEVDVERVSPFHQMTRSEIAGGYVAPVAPVAPVVAPVAAPAPKAAFDYDSDSVADEISKSLETLVGTTNDVAPKAEPKHPVNDTTTSKFSSLTLQFGRNYDLGKK